MTILYDNCKKPFEGTDEQAVELGEVLCGDCLVDLGRKDNS